MKKCIFHNAFCLLIVLSLSATAWAQSHKPPATAGPKQIQIKKEGLDFVENKGQWVPEARFRAELPGGAVFITDRGFVYNYYNPEDISKATGHDADGHEHTGVTGNETIHFHAYKVNFIGAQTDIKYEQTEKRRNYNNYYLGNDPSKWAGNVGLFGKVLQKNIYNGIDLAVYSKGQSMKYDFIVAAGADPSQIVLGFEGVTPRLSADGHLIIKTSVNEIQEQAPYTYQVINGKNIEVKCHYTFKNGHLGFLFPEGYDQQAALIIDPVLVFATYSGGTQSSFYSFSTTYDADGNLIAGSQAYGAGWPATPGAYQAAFSGIQDVAINKYNATGTNLIYSTYYGGTNIELPHAMKVNAQDELVVVGSTTSGNLPVSAGAYDNSLSGLTDMFVARFNSTGTALLGATYIGGTGIEPQQFTFNAFAQIYGGAGAFNNLGAISSPQELTFDANGNIWVTANTNSADFPTQLNPAFSTNTVYAGICPGDTYTFGPAILNTTGIYVDTFTTTGCDSIVTLHLFVKPYITHTYNHSICAGTSYNFGGQMLTTTGNYIDTFATAGCDSIVTLNLTVTPLTTNAVSAAICAGSTYHLGPQLLTTAGTYTQAFQTTGCDSVVTLTLTVNPYLRDTLHEKFCSGSNYRFGNDTLTTAGTYTDTFKTFGGCDSIVMLYLSTDTLTTFTVNAGFCPGGSYTFGTTVLTTAGVYVDTFTTSNCDSIVTLYLFEKPYIRNTVNASICINGSYTFGTTVITTGGTYVDTFATAGCDSIVTLNLEVKPNILNALNVALCPGTSYTFGTQVITTAGIYIQTFPTATCDSVVTLTVTVNPYITHSATEAMCPGGGYLFGSTVLTAPGVYVDTFSTTGCDSIVTLTLTGAYSNTLNGGIDVVLFQLDPSCSNLMFSRYLGGAGDDASTSLLFNNAGNLVLCGLTSSNNFPTTTGALFTASQGGTYDGFTSIIDPYSGNVLRSTYLGTNAIDQAVNVQVDADDNVYILGRTSGAYPVSAGAWNSNNNGDVFIDKLNPTLSTSIQSTRVGNPQGGFQQFFPSAFLVDICQNVYVAGFNAVAGMPLTGDAFQTNAASFWFCTIQPNFTGLLYGTYFGVNGDHSHIGIHRLDPDGIVYHSICNNVQYPFTAPTVWAPNKLNGFNQDIISFKFNFEATGVNSAFDLDPQQNDTGCAPYTVQMVNNSTAALSYTWDFGDNTGIVTATNPSHTYTSPGVYTITLHALNPNTCITDDSSKMQIVVLETKMPDITVKDTTLCASATSVDLSVTINNPSPNNTILWTPAAGILSADNLPTVTVNPNAFNEYYVTVKDTIPGICGFSVTDTVHIDLAPRMLDIVTNDTTVCEGVIVQVVATGTPAYSYHWSPAIGVSDTTILNPQISVNQSNIYSLTGSYHSCPDTTVLLRIDMHKIPELTLSPDKTVCQGTEVALESAITPFRNDYQYRWTPNTPNLSNPFGPNTSFIADTTITYQLYVQTPIGCADSQTVDIIVHPGNFGAVSRDTGYCPGNAAPLWASGGVSYAWTPAYGLSDTTTSNPVASPLTSTNYTVYIRDKYNCLDTEYVAVQVYPQAVVNVPDSVTIYPGEQYHVEPGTNASYFKWFPPSGLSNDHIADPMMSPAVRTRYFITATTEMGCIVLDSIDVLVKETVIDMPNAFAPSGVNRLFKPSKRGIARLKEFSIYNRWGNKVYSSTDIEAGWDGTYKGEPQPVGVYIYNIDAVNDKGIPFVKKGNVTLIR